MIQQLANTPNLLLFPIISFLTVFGLVLYTVYSSCSAVLYLSHSKLLAVCTVVSFFMFFGCAFVAS